MSMNLPRLVQNATRKYFNENGIILVDGENIPEQSLSYNKEILYKFIREEIKELTERVHKYQMSFNEFLRRQQEESESGLSER